MSSNYNLSDNVDNSFGIVLRGLKYEMRYPITEEIEAIQKISLELEKAKDEKDNEKILSVNSQLEDFMYGLISPVDHTTPIKDALKKENIRVMRNFNKMIQTELAM